MVVPRAIGGAVAGGFLGGMIWLVATYFFGRNPLLGGYVGILAVLIGTGAGYGALLATDRSRGPVVQGVAVAVAVLWLVAFQWAVVWLHLRWLQAALAEVGKQMAETVSWWTMVTEGFLGTYFFDLRVLNDLGEGSGVVPGLIFWTIAVANAMAIPRRYAYDDGD